jgi:hypothetical protein
LAVGIIENNSYKNSSPVIISEYITGEDGILFMYGKLRFLENLKQDVGVDGWKILKWSERHRI